MRRLVGLVAVAALAAAVPTVASEGAVAAAAAGPPPRAIGRTNRLPAGDPVMGMAATPSGLGYWLVGSDGGVFTFGDARFFGSMGGTALSQPVVGMAATLDGGGYWLVASDGGVFSFGDAVFYGSTGAIHLAQPVVGMAATATGHGYWLVASDGGIFTFGDAGFFGSAGGIKLAKPVTGMAATRDGGGYWLVASDGGIFTYGDAPFLGSMGGRPLAAPIMRMMATPGGAGYWLVALDGGIFTFGGARFWGSMGGVGLDRWVLAAAPLPAGGGYWIATGDGAVFNFGAARFYGSAIPAGPMRVGEYGDSLAMQAVPFFNNVLGGAVTREIQYGGASICSWFDQMQQDAATFRPEAVVLEFSGDAMSPCMNGVQLYTPAYYAKYEADEVAAIALFERIGARVYVAGYPVSLGTESNPLWDQLNQDYASIAGASPDATYIDAGASVENNGAFAFSLPCLYFEPCLNQPSPGQNLVRDPAGSHFCPDGNGTIVGVIVYCDTWASGAYRYGSAMASGVVNDFRL